MRRIPEFRGFSAVLAASLVLAACGQDPQEAASAKSGDGAVQVVRLGHVAPLTGPQAHLGKDNENGARLAIDELNAKGVMVDGKPVKFELLGEDDHADPRAATIVAQKLVDANVVGVLGHLNSGATIPASKIYHEAEIPQISPSATAIAYTTQGFKTAYRVMTNDAQQGRVLGDYAVKKLSGQRVAIIDDRTAYGQGLADEVEKAIKAAGGDVVAREFTTDKATDFTAILTGIKGKSPDVIFFGGMDPQAGPMVSQMKRLGITAQYLAGDGAQTAEFLKLAGPDAEGVIASNPGVPVKDMPGGPEFLAKFEARFGRIQNYAPYVYDAAYVMVDAIQRAGSTESAKILSELAKTDFRGVTGRIQFDGKGDLTGGNVTLYQVRGGEWQVLETVASGGD
ncbi:MAG: branched-chain amino acid ABC transporter substrate-binding protein [Thiotrichales bacterium]